MDATSNLSTDALQNYLRQVAARTGLFLRAYAFPIALFVFLRVWDSVWAYLVENWTAATRPELMFGLTPITQGIAGVLWGPWLRWDTVWYVKIATQGYSNTNLTPAFFFLYPLLIKLFAAVVGDPVGAGVLLASGAALVSFILLYRFMREVQGKGVARATLLFLAVFPSAFFLFAAYTESLFLAFALGAIMAARARRWELAGVCGALAAMIRPQGLVFFLPLAVEFVLQYRSGQVALRRVWTVGLTLLGGLVPFLFLTFQFGSPQIWFATQARWHYTVMPWESLGEVWWVVFHAPTVLDAIRSFPDAFFAVLFLGFLVWSAFRLSPTLTVYMAIIVLPPLFARSTYEPDFPLASMSRYVLLAFPAFLLLGRLRWRRWQAPLLAVSFLVQTLGLVLFVVWVFVG